MTNLLATELIRKIEDFPHHGKTYLDISPVLANPVAFHEVIEHLAVNARNSGAEAIAGIESKGIILAAPVAIHLGLPLIIIRKLGQLPPQKITEEYVTDNGTNALEIQQNFTHQGQKVYIIDDLLVTGSTSAAATRLIERLDGKVSGLGFLGESTALDGRNLLLNYDIHVLLEY